MREIHIQLRDKPPLWLMPMCIWNEIRKKEITEAITRYIENGNMEIPTEWITEYNNIISQ